MLRHLLACSLVLALAPGCGDAATGATDTSTDTSIADSAPDSTSDAAPDSTSDAAPDAAADIEATTCTLTANTSVVATAASGCALLARDAGACRASREADGLSGFWLTFSCRVALSRVTADGIEVVRTVADGQPDYPSMYFQASDLCYAAWADGQPNPNHIVATTRTIDVPLSPVVGTAAMAGGIVGVALNGVPIFGDFAAPGDDIFLEVETFDRCGAHPTQNGTYHYHGEPVALSNDDARFIGVMRDGYPIYGRRDADGSLPALDAQGGHSAVTADSAGAAVYHYHLNEQVSSAPLTAGQRQWFLTTGTYHGAPTACSDCR